MGAKLTITLNFVVLWACMNPQIIRLVHEPGEGWLLISAWSMHQKLGPRTFVAVKFFCMPITCLPHKWLSFSLGRQRQGQLPNNVFVLSCDEFDLYITITSPSKLVLTINPKLAYSVISQWISHCNIILRIDNVSQLVWYVTTWCR